MLYTPTTPTMPAALLAPVMPPPALMRRRTLILEFTQACQGDPDITPAGIALQREFDPPAVGVRWRIPNEYTGYYLLVFPSGCHTCALYEEDAQTGNRQRVAIWQLATLTTGAELLAQCRQASADRAWAEFQAENGCAVVL